MNVAQVRDGAANQRRRQMAHRQRPSHDLEPLGFDAKRVVARAGAKPGERSGRAEKDSTGHHAWSLIHGSGGVAKASVQLTRAVVCISTNNVRIAPRVTASPVSPSKKNA